MTVSWREVVKEVVGGSDLCFIGVYIIEELQMSAPKGRKEKIFYHRLGFTLCQQNGQRTYGGPPPNWGARPPPSRDCEVFIGRLPRTCFEDELIPLFLSAGELYEFRLMLDFSGTNRGYGYAHYATLAGAQRAIETLNKFEIRPGHQIGVLKSKNNCRLLFGNISSALKVEAFNEFIRTTTDQVLNVLMFKNFQQLKQTDFRISSEVEEAFLGRMPRNNGSNQFAIVEYENHKAAAVARRILIPKYGHILAIDWAVPPRDKKRFGNVPESQPIERPMPNAAMKEDSNVLMFSKLSAKIRPVPVLLVQPSALDNATFLPKTFKTLVKFLKYQLSVCLYKSVDQMEIPLYICKEIERKIVDRITNLDNCSQAVQLIFNYFSWFNEKKPFVINSEVQQLLEEVKAYADLFLYFVNKWLKHGASQNSGEDNYYGHILPLQLNILFRIILRSDAERQARLSSGITKSLKWLEDVMQKGGRASQDFMAEIVNLVKNEDGTSLDKASTLAKSLFLNTITSHQQSQNVLGNNLPMDMPKTKAVFKNNGSVENITRLEENPRSGQTFFLPPYQADFNFQHVKGGPGLYIPKGFSQTDLFNEEIGPNPDGHPSVPLLLVQPSIMNKVPFMPDIFNNVLAYFKHLIRVYLNAFVCQMNVPPCISNEIERKIIDRISNMENCAEGVQLILNYFSLWLNKESNGVVLELLQEVKFYADSFVNFVWSKTLSVYVPNEAAEDYFCKVLPLKLNILYQAMLIFSNETSTNPLVVGITKGLGWLEEIIQKGDKMAKQFIEELTRFIIELDPSAYERARNLAKAVCGDSKNCSGQAVAHQGINPFVADDKNSDRNSNSSFINEIPSGFSIIGSDNASDGTFEYDS